MHAKLLRHVRLFATPWTIAHQAPRFIGLGLGLTIVVVQLLSSVQLFATPQTDGLYTMQSVDFSRSEYWSG